MKPYFLFPADPLNKRRIDEAFQDQAKALTDAGYGYGIVNLEDDSIFSPRGGTLPQTPFKQDKIVYRGWMLNEHEYNQLEGLVDFYGGKLGTSKEQYYSAHYIPNWYPTLSDLTAETLTFPNEFLNLEELPDLLRTLGWKEYFVKDYVKSLKTAGGSMIHDPEQITRVVAEMEKYRGEIEGGICVRKFEEYIPQTEIRFFIRDGKVYVPKVDHNISIMMMNGQAALANEVASRMVASFFSVDIAVRNDFVPRVIECGDGQVSDLVGWTPEEFAQIWK